MKVKNQKGITLVALIITIIVLLILAVVAIREVTGDGIIAHAKNAANSYEEAQRTEQSMLENYLSQIEAGIYPTPTDQKYFSFILDKIAKTATVTGIADEWAYKSGNYKTAIQVEEGKYITDIVIPRKYVDADGTEYTVTAIGNSAFSGGRSLTSFVIPNTVTAIGLNAFGECSSLTSINIPSSITSIESATFCGCNSLTSITIPNSVTSIGDYAFNECLALTSITIPSSVTSIGDDLFEYTSLTSIYCEATSQPSGWNARWKMHCNATVYWKEKQPADQKYFEFTLDEATFTATVTGIADEWAYKYGDGYSYYKTAIQVEEGNYITDIVIPSKYVDTDGTEYTVTAIGNNAFHSDPRAEMKFTSFMIPNTVTTIGDQAFYYCDSLISINIPSSVTSIGSSAFTGCRSLNSIYCEAASQPLGWGSSWNSYCNATVYWRTMVKQW